MLNKAKIFLFALHKVSDSFSPFLLWIRDGSSLDSTRLARLDTIAKQGPGSTRPARKPEMLILDWLEASLF